MHSLRHAYTVDAQEGLCEESESAGRSVVSDSLRPHGPYSPWNPPGRNTGIWELCANKKSQR